MTLAFALAAVAAACASSPPAETLAAGDEVRERDDDALPLDPEVRKGTLENGLTYYVRENDEPADRASLRLALDAGSILEDEDQQGLAHFLEHMAFHGTERFERDDIIGFFQDIGMRFGAHVNAHVSFDETVYRIDLPTEDDAHIDRALQIFEEWAHRMRLEPEQIERERSVIVEEWRERLGAAQRLREETIPVLLRGSRYAERLPIGDMDVIENFEHEALHRFYEDWYRPDLMAVVAVGDFDAEEIEARIEETFGRVPMPDDAPERPRYSVPAHDETLYAIASDPEQPETIVSIHNKTEMPPLQTEADYRDEIAMRLFARMFRVRLDELIRDADAPLTSARGGRSRLAGPAGSYVLRAATRPDAVEEALAALTREVVRIREFGFTEEEVGRAKQNLLRSMEQAYRQRDDVESQSLAGDYVEAFLEGWSAPGIEREYALYQRLVPEIGEDELRERADRFLRPENRVVTLRMPEGERAEPLEEEGLAAALEAVDPGALEPYEEDEAGAELAPVADEGGEIVEETFHEELGAYEWELSNGARVAFKPTEYRSGEIQMSALSRGGLSQVETENLVNAELATRFVREGGVGPHSKRDLERILSGRTIELEPYLDGVAQGLRGQTSPEDLETFLQLLGLYLDEPRRDERAYAAVRQQIENELEHVEATPGFQVNRRLNELLTEDHPRPGPLEFEDLENLDYEAVLEVYRERFADPGSFAYVFVGDVEAETLRPLVERYIGGLPSPGRDEEVVDHGITHPEGAVEASMEVGEAPQGQVVLVYHGDYEFEFEENIALSLLADAVQGRLLEYLRDEKDAIYSVNANVETSRDPKSRYALVFVFGADPERVGDIAELARDEIARFREGEVGEDAAERAIEAARRQHEEQAETNAFWVGQLVSLYRYGLEPEEVAGFRETLEASSPADLRGAAEAYLSGETYVQFLLRPAGEE